MFITTPRPSPPLPMNPTPETKAMSTTCMIPPAGWHCTRRAGHEGPCAAVPATTPASYPPESLADLTPDELQEYEQAAAGWPQMRRVLNAYKGAQASRQYGRDIINDMTLEAALRATPPTPVEEADKWIAVSERLPEERGAYIACNANGIVSTEWYSVMNGCFVIDSGISPDNITHWRPLPTPPTSQEGGGNE